MEIQSLKLIVTEGDINDLLRTRLPPNAPVRKPKVRVTTGAVRISGQYPTGLVPVPFETAWEPAVRGGELAVRLTDLKVVGLPAGAFRKTILGGFSALAAKQPGLRTDGDTLLIDLDQVLRHHGVPVRTNLKAVRCEEGQLVLEA